MLGVHDLWFFIASGLVLNITPGPDTAYIVGRSAQLGWRGGAVAALGISAGCLVHVLACAIGTPWCLGVAAVAAKAVRGVRQSVRAKLRINRVLGGMFVCLGARIAMLQAR